MANVILVDEKWISFHQYLRYCHQSVAIVSSTVQPVYNDPTWSDEFMVVNGQVVLISSADPTGHFTYLKYQTQSNLLVEH